MTNDLKWKEAITKVLGKEKKALHYTEIAEFISERGYRKSLGATPQDTVNSVLTTDINTNKEQSIFAKVDKGMYILRQFLDDSSQFLTEEEIEIGGKISQKRTPTENNRVINAFGIYWNRNLVHWKTTPDLLGIQQSGASDVNFKDQIGIYLLHDNREIIYVGQAIDQPLGQRVKIHTTDRLSGRWDRFSWFGFYPVNENGGLDNNKKFENISVKNLGDALEAILIESIEPRQNRKQGNLFFGLEYIQQEAPEIKNEQLLRELSKQLAKSGADMGK